MSRVFVLLAALCAAGCWSPSGPDAISETPFMLKVGETATLDDDFRIRFDSVRSDSRCPLDALCVRAGEAIITVSVRAANGRAESHEMRTDAAGSQIAFDNHTIELTALSPYPRASQAIDPRDYVATFVVHTR